MNWRLLTWLLKWKPFLTRNQIATHELGPDGNPFFTWDQMVTIYLGPCCNIPYLQPDGNNLFGLNNLLYSTKWMLRKWYCIQYNSCQYTCIQHIPNKPWQRSVITIRRDRTQYDAYWSYGYRRQTSGRRTWSHRQPRSRRYQDLDVDWW